MSKYKRKDEIFELVKVYLPKSIAEILKEKRMGTNIPRILAHK